MNIYANITYFICSAKLLIGNTTGGNTRIVYYLPASARIAFSQYCFAVYINAHKKAPTNIAPLHFVYFQAHSIFTSGTIA